MYFQKKVTAKWNGIFYHSNWCLCYSYVISDNKMVHLTISKVTFTIALSVKSCSQVKWYILPFQLMYVLFLWYIILEKEAKFIFSCCWSCLVLSVLNHFEIWFKSRRLLNSIYEELGDVHVRTVCLQVQIQVGEVGVKVQEQLSESSVRFSKLQFWWRLTLFRVLNLNNEYSMLNNLWNFQCSMSNSSDFLRLLWIQDTHLPLFEF